MRLTTPDNLPVPEPGDDVDPLEDWFGDLADAAQKALRRDTGWIAIPVTDTRVVSDTSEPAQYRVLNGICYLRGQFNSKTTANLPGGSYGTLPAAACPIGQRQIANAYQGSPTNFARLIVGTNGTLTFTSLTTTYVRLDQASPFPVAS